MLAIVCLHIRVCRLKTFSTALATSSRVVRATVQQLCGYTKRRRRKGRGELQRYVVIFSGKSISSSSGERERELVGQEKHRDQTEIVFIYKKNTVLCVSFLLFSLKDLKMTVATAVPGANFFKL